MRLLLLIVYPSCVLWDGTPYRENAARLTDADGDGWTLADEDCNDADPDVHPLAEEVCDGVDNDCNGQVDEVPPDTVWCLDVDGDGYGDIARQVQSCFPDESWVRDCSDCDDGNRLVSPGGVEICNGIDDDCDGTVDPVGSEGAPEWYTDADGDGYGSDQVAARACEQPPHTAAGSGDCNDLAASAHPGAVEICGDGLDNDCDGTRNGCGWSGSDVLDTSFASFIAGPEAEREYLGITLGFADANGDGVQDVVMSGQGGMYGDTTAGSIHAWYGAPTGARSIDQAGGHAAGAHQLYLGSVTGPSIVPVTTDAGGPMLLLPTTGLSEEFGEEGVILGHDLGLYGTESATPSWVFARGEEPVDVFGSVVTPLPVEGDAGPTLCVSAHGYSRDAWYQGAVYLVDQGAPNAIDALALVVGAEEDFLGTSVAVLDDVDGDGVGDWVIGLASRRRGGVAIVHGPLSGEYRVDESDLVVLSERGAGGFGDRVLVVSDVSGDGLPDIASPYVDSGDESHDRLDRVYFISGAVTGAPSIEEAVVGFLHDDGVGGGIGYGLATDDIHSDGVPDLVVGCPTVDAPSDLGGGDDVGAVAIVPLDQEFSGGLRLWDAADAAFYSPDKDSYTGYQVATGDANSDGFPDLLVSSTHWEGNGYYRSGGVWFLLGGGI